jgi:23S rRNA (adenine2503-C2)-methyltransferase
MNVRIDDEYRIKPLRSFYLPSGRVIVSKTHDGHLIESTEMRDVSVEGKENEEVRTTLDPHVIWKHLKPVDQKWLLTVSTQVGCTYRCNFCDVAKLGFKRNLTSTEIMNQIYMLVDSTPEILNVGTTKAKIGFARMGEPMQNLQSVLLVIKNLADVSRINGWPIEWLPCFNSIVPSKVLLDGGDYISGLDALARVILMKETQLGGRMHIQISVNSTDENARRKLFNGADVVPLAEIVDLVNKIDIHNRTITLNFISMDGVELDGEKLAAMGLSGEKFAVKVIPLNATDNAQAHDLRTRWNYNNVDSLKKFEDDMRKLGVPIVTDAIAKCEEAGLCCGQLVNRFYSDLKD